VRLPWFCEGLGTGGGLGGFLVSLGVRRDFCVLLVLEEFFWLRFWGGEFFFLGGFFLFVWVWVGRGFFWGGG